MNEKSRKFLNVLLENKVVILFTVLCIGAIAAANKPLSFVVVELFTRIGRNTFLVLALLIPVLAGMGLNFGIVIGAIAAQIAVFWVVYWGFTGISGFLLCVVISTPLAVLFGAMVGRLFNKMKGSEMIGGMVLSYFADGLYQLLFLFIIGGVIPVDNPQLIIAGGTGVKNTIDLKGNLKYALDDVPMLTIVEIGFYLFVAVVVLTHLYQLVKKQHPSALRTLLLLAVGFAVYGITFLPYVESFLSTDRLMLLSAVELAVFGAVLWQLYQIIRARMLRREDFNGKRAAARIAAAAVIYALTYIPMLFDLLVTVQLPVLTYLCIGGLCGFNSFFMRTRLGQNMRTVGQSRTVANAAGIQVDRTRVTAMILSTVLASWGQLISLQNIGTFSTYGAHTQVGLFAIAALLVGGASVHKATNSQAILGVILFHTLFIVAPQAGNELFGNAQIGEYFRVFVAYGVIALSLAMHVWKTRLAPKTPAASPTGDQRPQPAK